MLGVGSGILASLAAVGFPPAVLAQFAGVATIGGTMGSILGRRITATELPQMVAALHSVVGLAAVFTSIASVLADVSHISTLHLVTAYLGVLIGEHWFLPKPANRLMNTTRWHHLHWIYRGLFEIGWTYVLKTFDTSSATPYQQFAFGS